MNTIEDKGFVKGVAYTMGILNSWYDVQSAEAVKKESGLTWQDLLAANVDPYDLKNCFTLFHTEDDAQAHGYPNLETYKDATIASLTGYYFTFGQSHTHQIGNISLNKDTVVHIDNGDYATARAAMHELFRNKWAFQYDAINGLEGFKIHYPGGIVEYDDLLKEQQT